MSANKIYLLFFEQTKTAGVKAAIKAVPLSMAKVPHATKKAVNHVGLKVTELAIKHPKIHEQLQDPDTMASILRTVSSLFGH